MFQITIYNNGYGDGDGDGDGDGGVEGDCGGGCGGGGGDASGASGDKYYSGHVKDFRSWFQWWQSMQHLPN